MIPRLDVLERLLAKYAQARYEYGWGYKKPSGETVRFLPHSARQFDPSSWREDFSTKPGTPFRVGFTEERKTALPPSNAVAVEETPSMKTRTLSGDWGTARVHPGFESPGRPGIANRKVYGPGGWRAEKAAPPPDFMTQGGTPMPRYAPYVPLGVKAAPEPASLPPSPPPIPGVLGSSPGPDVRKWVEKILLERHGSDAVKQ